MNPLRFSGHWRPFRKSYSLALILLSSRKHLLQASFVTRSCLGSLTSTDSDNKIHIFILAPFRNTKSTFDELVLPSFQGFERSASLSHVIVHWVYLPSLLYKLESRVGILFSFFLFISGLTGRVLVQSSSPFHFPRWVWSSWLSERTSNISVFHGDGFLYPAYTPPPWLVTINSKIYETAKFFTPLVTSPSKYPLKNATLDPHILAQLDAFIASYCKAALSICPMATSHAFSSLRSSQVASNILVILSSFTGGNTRVSSENELALVKDWIQSNIPKSITTSSPINVFLSFHPLNSPALRKHLLSNWDSRLNIYDIDQVFPLLSYFPAEVLPSLLCNQFLVEQSVTVLVAQQAYIFLSLLPTSVGNVLFGLGEKLIKKYFYPEAVEQRITYEKDLFLQVQRLASMSPILRGD